MVDMLRHLFSNLFTEHIHPETLQASQENLYTGILTNIIVISVCTYVVAPYIPFYLILSGLFVNLTATLLRARVLSNIPPSHTILKDSRPLLIYTLIMSILGLSWGALSITAVLYCPPLEFLFIALLISGMSAGSVATISPIFTAHRGYFFLLGIPVFISFLLSTESLLQAFSFVILFYIYIVYSAGKKLHENLVKIIDLKTKEVLLNDDLILEKARTEQANRSKTRFISSMSHELKTPLNAIIGFTQLLKLSDQLSEEDQENLEQIDIAGEQLNKLINNVLKLSNLMSDETEPDLSPVSIERTVEEAISTIKNEARDASISISSDIDNTTVIADEMLLQQMFLHLLSNAIQYNHRGGQIKIFTQQTTSNTIKICVEDTGIGIAEKQKDKIFSAFNRLGNEAKSIAGAGIGLYFTKILIEKMNGKVGFESTLGKGSTFWLELPMDENYQQDFD